MTEPEFVDCLRAHYDPKAYVVIPQVRNGTGFNTRTRTADALVVSLWPSRGIDVTGFEFKDSRTDWLKELRAPEKAEEIGRFCSRWYVAASSLDIVHGNELPAMWGQMIARDGKMNIIKHAPVREAQQPTWTFVAAVLRAASEVVTDEGHVQKRLAALRGELQDQYSRDIHAARERERAIARKDYDQLLAVIREFETDSGVKLSTYHAMNNTHIAAAVKLVLEMTPDRLTEYCRSIITDCDKQKKLAEAALAVATAKLEGVPA